MVDLYNSDQLYFVPTSNAAGYILYYNTLYYFVLCLIHYNTFVQFPRRVHKSAEPFKLIFFFFLYKKINMFPVIRTYFFFFGVGFPIQYIYFWFIILSLPTISHYYLRKIPGIPGFLLNIIYFSE